MNRIPDQLNLRSSQHFLLQKMGLKGNGCILQKSSCLKPHFRRIENSPKMAVRRKLLQLEEETNLANMNDQLGPL